MSKNLPKVIFLGTSFVGKTSLLSSLRGIRNIAHKPTSVMGVFQVQGQMNGQTFDYLYCDTCGQDSLNSLLPMYIRGSQIAILVYSITDKASFGMINKYINTAQSHEKDITFILVGNKMDLTEREVEYQEGCDLADSLDIPFYETSAKDGTNIENLKSKIERTVYEKKIEPINSVSLNSSVKRGCMCKN